MGSVSCGLDCLSSLPSVRGPLWEVVAKEDAG